MPGTGDGLRVGAVGLIEGEEALRLRPHFFGHTPPVLKNVLALVIGA